MLTRWYRVGCSSCSLNIIPLVLKLRLPLVRHHFVGFPKSTCDVVPTDHGFARAAVFLDSLRRFSLYLYNLRNSYLVPFGNDALRLVMTPAELLHMCRRTFLLQCVRTHRTASFRR